MPAIRGLVPTRGWYEMEHVDGYYKKVHGKRVRVRGYERKSHDHLTAHDREVDRRNLRRRRR